MKKSTLYNADGTPRFVRCYEIKRNPPVDRFTVVYTRANIWGGKRWQGRMFYVGMSDNPFHPQGVGQHGEAWFYDLGGLGSRIAFTELPDACQKLVRQEYADLWRDTV